MINPVLRNQRSIKGGLQRQELLKFIIEEMRYGFVLGYPEFDQMHALGCVAPIVTPNGRLFTNC